MADKDPKKPQEADSKKARVTSTTSHTLKTNRGKLKYTAAAGWMTLQEHDQPVAEMFHVAYLKDDVPSSKRPITFVFNGGPGASAAYLHVGALGPKRVLFNPDGSMPKPPAKLGDNEDSWLYFTDLVFVDPIGTGFSRALVDANGGGEKDSKESDNGAKLKEKSKAFWEVKRDLDVLGEFIQKFLSKHRRWDSPVFIAGESYGGYRVARLMRKLQEDYGVGLNGAILISPALEFALLGGSDYDILYWADMLPTMAATAYQHGKKRVESDSLASHILAAERFARERLVPALALGSAMPDADRDAVFEEMAALTGLSSEYVKRQEGRIGMVEFCREMLRGERRVLGLYDTSMTSVDPFPDRDRFEGPDVSLAGIGRMFTGAVNTHLRSNLGVEDTRDYHLLNFDAFANWKFENEGEMRQGFITATDDFRYGMSLNPHMQVFITHGYFDMVTPYFSSNRLADLMRLDPSLRENLTLQHFKGGHMFYTWEESRRAFFTAMKDLYERAV